MTGIAVAGVTASGKSELAVSLALRHGGEVVSCDSMLVYRGCDIGTAKPDRAEMRGVPHHLIDILDPSEPFSAADFVAAAERAEGKILARGALPVLCGGTGLYLDAFLRGGFREEKLTPYCDELRARLGREAEMAGAAAMHDRLRSVDPESAEKIHPNNLRRVLRALELYELTGRKKSELDRAAPQHTVVRDYRVVALRFSDKAVRDAAIETRVRRMFDAGLPEETERLRSAGVFDSCAAAAQAIGYKELFLYLDGLESREAAIARLAAATRRYAKRQMTWYAAVPYVMWISVDENGRRKSPEALLEEAEKLLFTDQKE